MKSERSARSDWRSRGEKGAAVLDAIPADLVAAVVDYLRDWLPVWVKHDADLGNHDIAAELIMVARCIGLADDERWGAVLRSAQTGEGMVPVRGAGAARSSRAPPRRGAGPSSTTTTPPWWR